MTRHLAHEWTGFRERVVPVNARLIQVVEMRRAFYAGAEALLRSLLRNLRPGLDADPSDIQLMEDLAAELRAFADDVASGKA